MDTRNELPSAERHGDLPDVRTLPGKETNPNFKAGFKANALYDATEEGNREVVELHLGSGSNPNREGGFRPNPLHIAAKRENVLAVDVSLESGVDMVPRHGSGSILLHFAAEETAPLLSRKQNSYPEASERIEPMPTMPPEPLKKTAIGRFRTIANEDQPDRSTKPARQSWKAQHTIVQRQTRSSAAGKQITKEIEYIS